MTYWDSIDSNVLTHEIVNALNASSASGNDWINSSHDDTKSLLRSILFPAQASKCAYCRRSIRDEVGHVEIDHILPKAPSHYTSNANSNNDDHRRSTFGYPQFLFTALNLVLTCKRCNIRKGTYDARTDRSVAVAANYSDDPLYYTWVHPYLHTYSDHIEVRAGCIYLPVDQSPDGKAVIKACNLASLAAIEQNCAELAISDTMELSEVLLQLWARPELSLEYIGEIVSEKFYQLDPEMVSHVLSNCDRQFLGLQRAVNSLSAML